MSKNIKSYNDKLVVRSYQIVSSKYFSYSYGTLSALNNLAKLILTNCFMLFASRLVSLNF